MSHGFRLLEEDEFPHAPGLESNFNESAYGNAFDDKTGIGGWARVGNRVNEQYAEKSVVLYLPNGQVACSFGRPMINSNDKWDAEGLKIQTITPFKHQRITYQGEVHLFDDCSVLRDPKTAFSKAPRAQADVLWDFKSDNPLHGGSPLGDDQQTMYGRNFSRNHFNQHAAVTGHIRIGETEYPIAGHGWRDHSWGPRHWSHLYIYRLFLASFDDKNGLMLLKIFAPDGSARSAGAFLIDGVYHEVMDLSVMTEWNDALEPVRAKVAVRTATQSHLVEVESVTTAPLRNRRQENGETLHTQILETHAKYRWNGREAFGMSEYIDRLEGDRPAGPPV